MELRSSTIRKRKRDVGFVTSDVASKVDVTAQTSFDTQGIAKVGPFSRTVSETCRAALIKSSATARTALAKNRSSIDPKLVEMLELIGGYDERLEFRFHTSQLSLRLLVDFSCIN